MMQFLFYFTFFVANISRKNKYENNFVPIVKVANNHIFSKEVKLQVHAPCGLYWIRSIFLWLICIPLFDSMWHIFGMLDF